MVRALGISVAGRGCQNGAVSKYACSGSGPLCAVATRVACVCGRPLGGARSTRWGGVRAPARDDAQSGLRPPARRRRTDPVSRRDGAHVPRPDPARGVALCGRAIRSAGNASPAAGPGLGSPPPAAEPPGRRLGERPRRMHECMQRRSPKSGKPHGSSSSAPFAMGADEDIAAGAATERKGNPSGPASAGAHGADPSFDCPSRTWPGNDPVLNQHNISHNIPLGTLHEPRRQPQRGAARPTLPQQLWPDSRQQPPQQRQLPPRRVRRSSRSHTSTSAPPPNPLVPHSGT